MKTIIRHLKLRIKSSISLLSLLALFASGCEPDNSALINEANLETKNDLVRKANSKVVDITSSGMNFTAPSQIPSGWTTFRFSNYSSATHFFMLQKLPEGKTVEDSKTDIIPVFQDAMNLLNVGDQSGFNEFANLPGWFFDIIYRGGTGLVSPGNIAETSLHLSPGYYVIECYVKTSSGLFHSYLGMVEGIEVMDIDNNISEPKADLEIAISSTLGIEIPNKIRPGLQTVAVHFKDQITHENLLGHDLHLARMEEGADIAALADWMNWINPDGFKSNPPAGFEFLGGTQEMQAGEKSYFNVLLKPGTYVLIAEVPDPITKNMLKTFTIPLKD